MNLKEKRQNTRKRKRKPHDPCCDKQGEISILVLHRLNSTPKTSFCFDPS